MGKNLTVCVSAYDWMTYGSWSIPLISRRRTCPLNSRICKKTSMKTQNIWVHYTETTRSRMEMDTQSEVDAIRNKNVSSKFITFMSKLTTVVYEAEIVDLKLSQPKIFSPQIKHTLNAPFQLNNSFLEVFSPLLKSMQNFERKSVSYRYFMAIIVDLASI